MRWLMRWLHALAGRDARANRPSHPGRGVAKLAAMSRHRTRSNAFPTAVPILGGVSELARKYDGFILDIWGVIHDGVKPYPGAVACLRRLKAGGKRVALLSNAPRRVAALVQAMAAMGIPGELYHGVLSSGELAYQELRTRRDPWYAALGRACYHLGPERDKSMLEGLDLEPAARVEEAGFILNTGLDRDQESVADYEPVLAAGAARGIPMICANPDLEVVRGGRRIVCAGALAARYEALGGEVRYHGKPDAPIYEACVARLGGAAPERTVAVGDSLLTDIAGAQALGLDTVLVAGGIHGDALGMGEGGGLDGRRLTEFCVRAGHMPTAAIPAFVW